MKIVSTLAKIGATRKFETEWNFAGNQSQLKFEFFSALSARTRVTRRLDFFASVYWEVVGALGTEPKYTAFEILNT